MMAQPLTLTGRQLVVLTCSGPVLRLLLVDMMNLLSTSPIRSPDLVMVVTLFSSLALRLRKERQ